ncbi:MAG: PorT family protein [Bacteroidaceae bacterium]|nr:PorT family protein [Bacteroidaceae bacterium]
MMMRRIIFLFFLCICFTSHAQHIQLKAGGGLSKLDSQSSAVPAWRLGAGYEFEFDQHWTFSPALLFAIKGWESPDEIVYKKDDSGNILVDPETGNPLTGVKNTETVTYHVELPLLFNYYLRTKERQYVVFSAGPYVAYGISGKTKVKGDTDRQGAERFYYDYNPFSDGDAKRFEAGVQVGVGYQFSNGITAGVDLNYAFTKVIGNRKPVSALLSFSYMFRK